jgi:hypothetical protein
MVIAALIVFGSLLVAWLVAPAEERRIGRQIATEALPAAA